MTNVKWRIVNLFLVLEAQEQLSLTCYWEGSLPDSQTLERQVSSVDNQSATTLQSGSDDKMVRPWAGESPQPIPFESRRLSRTSSAGGSIPFMFRDAQRTLIGGQEREIAG
ncbi:hypothetical protein ANTPLA_LOCUS7412 [Anthophora plagiata]